jgi:hypothetical protein
MLLCSNKPLNKLVNNFFNDIANILHHVRDRVSDNKVLKEVVSLRETVVATQLKFDPDEDYSELIEIIKFLDILEYVVLYTKETWES